MKQNRISREISQVQTGADKSPNKAVRAKKKLLQLTNSDNKILSMNTPGLQSNTTLALCLREAEKKQKTPPQNNTYRKTNPNNQPQTSI